MKTNMPDLQIKSPLKFSRLRGLRCWLALPLSVQIITVSLFSNTLLFPPAGTYVRSVKYPANSEREYG